VEALADYHIATPKNHPKYQDIVAGKRIIKEARSQIELTHGEPEQHAALEMATMTMEMADHAYDAGANMPVRK